jgi:hypothetical protein
MRRWSQSLAVLDAVLSPERVYRYFSFNAQWGEDQMASMRNGSGDEYSIVFASEGSYLRGFDHESEMSPFAQESLRPWPGVIDEVPSVFHRLVAEPSFCISDVPAVTVCLWRLSGDTAWRHGAVTLPTTEGDPDGADWLFEQLDGRAETYRSYALDYFEKEIDLAAISHVYNHRRLTDEVISALNPELSLAELLEDLGEIGYPSTT